MDGSHSASSSDMRTSSIQLTTCMWWNGSSGTSRVLMTSHSWSERSGAPSRSGRHLLTVLTKFVVEILIERRRKSRQSEQRSPGKKLSHVCNVIKIRFCATATYAHVLGQKSRQAYCLQVLFLYVQPLGGLVELSGGHMNLQVGQMTKGPI